MSRLMSDYEVTLVNDNMQEFYVRFHGPVESESENGVVWVSRSSGSAEGGGEGRAYRICGRGRYGDGRRRWGG